MPYKITLITPTGGRPEAFALCKKWIAAQTLPPDQWIIVDDGPEPLECAGLPDFACYIRREPQASDPPHTLVVNVDAALSYIVGDKILFIEDDEYYAPEYVQIISGLLDQYQIVGIGHSKYYHLPTGGYFQHANTKHASLAQTAFRREMLPLVRACVNLGMEKTWLDDNLWKEAQKSNGIKSYIFKDEQVSLYCGIKGLPGRAGIGIGHKPKTYKDQDDQERGILRQWIPRDYQVYLDLLGACR